MCALLQELRCFLQAVQAQLVDLSVRVSPLSDNLTVRRLRDVRVLLLNQQSKNRGTLDLAVVFWVTAPITRVSLLAEQDQVLEVVLTPLSTHQSVMAKLLVQTTGQPSNVRCVSTDQLRNVQGTEHQFSQVGPVSDPLVPSVLEGSLRVCRVSLLRLRLPHRVSDCQLQEGTGRRARLVHLGVVRQIQQCPLGQVVLSSALVPLVQLLVQPSHYRDRDLVRVVLCLRRASPGALSTRAEFRVDALRGDVTQQQGSVLRAHDRVVNVLVGTDTARSGCRVRHLSRASCSPNSVLGRQLLVQDGSQLRLRNCLADTNVIQHDVLLVERADR